MKYPLRCASHLPLLLSFLLFLPWGLGAVTLSEVDLAEAEITANADNLARFTQGLMKTRSQPFWVYDDITLGADISLLNNVAMDIPIWEPREGPVVSWMFGLTVNMVNLRTPHYLDYGYFTLEQEDLLGANFFNGLNFYGEGWKLMTGINMTVTDHSIYAGKLFNPYLFTDFNILGKLIRPAVEWALPSEFSALFNRLSLSALTPFGTPKFTVLKIIGGSNATLTYSMTGPGVLPLNFSEDGFELRNLKWEFMVARNWNILEGGDNFGRFLAWESQIIHLTAFAPLEDSEVHPGRVFFTLAYNGRDGFGFQTGIDAGSGALILNVNTYLEGYHTTTLGKFSLYFRMAADLSW